MSARYITTHGEPTTAQDEQRVIWYSAQCTFWTDDWSLLKTVGPGIPCCPHCMMPGMQTMFKHWDKGAKEMDTREPGYYTFLQDVKDKCLGKGQAIGKIWNTIQQTGKGKLSAALKDLIEKHSNG